MKIPFRMILLSILLLMLGATALTIGGLSYRQARFMADALVRQYLDQASARIDLQITTLLGQADRLRAATETRLGPGGLDAGRPDDLVAHLRDALTISGGVTGYFVG